MITASLACLHSTLSSRFLELRHLDFNITGRRTEHRRDMEAQFREMKKIFSFTWASYPGISFVFVKLRFYPASLGFFHLLLATVVVHNHWASSRCPALDFSCQRQSLFGSKQNLW